VIFDGDGNTLRSKNTNYSTLAEQIEDNFNKSPFMDEIDYVIIRYDSDDIDDNNDSVDHGGQDFVVDDDVDDDHGGQDFVDDDDVDDDDNNNDDDVDYNL
jgi:hypothetical protein